MAVPTAQRPCPLLSTDYSAHSSQAHTLSVDNLFCLSVIDSSLSLSVNALSLKA